MSGPGNLKVSDAEALAVDRGRGEGLAIAALALSVVSFINLLGAEKALLAIVLAVLALGRAKSGLARIRSWSAIAIAAVYVASVATVLVIFRDQLGELIRLLQHLG